MVTIVKGDSVTTPNQYKDTITYNYNGTNGIDGSVQTFTVPVTGNYDLQVWGASGGNSSSGYLGGNGGYSKGTISLNKDDVLYIYVGGKGLDGVNGNTSQVGGYNGGGKVVVHHLIIMEPVVQVEVPLILQRLMVFFQHFLLQHQIYY